jgi:SAM-dependent methyltransferase
MGLSAGTIEGIIRLRKGGFMVTPGAVIEIGAQQLSNEFLRAHDRMEFLGQLFGVTTKLDLPVPEATTIVGRVEPQPETAPLARQFWEWLGFQYASIDIDGSPNSIPLDLNYDALPDWARNKFDVVTNFGTTEHIANQLNAFKIIHDLTAPGGIMIHAVPAQGWVNHGLLKYNPKWFWMLARSNDYRWLDFDYTSRGHITDLPDNVVEAVASHRPDIAERKARYKVVDSGLWATFQKVRDIEFIPPLDVNTGTKTTNAALIERYWTVFAPR